MILFGSPASPFARKVMACAIALELHERIEHVASAPATAPADLIVHNPLSKIPCLVTTDGTALYDSPVICEYLDSLEGGLALFPRSGGARWKALKQQALGDGMMDAAVLRRGESLRPVEDARTANMDKQKAAVDRSLAVLEADLPHLTVDIGSIAIGCALGYLDFRFPHEPWREAHPKLAAWFATFGENPCMAQTLPR